MLFSLYIHIPFCARKCAYCDFCSFPVQEATARAYCRALQKEIALTAERWPDAEIDTVFVGGGTPSVLPTDALDGVLAQVARRFTVRPNAEYTVEANPGTLRGDWLDTALSHGLNRLSLGVQARQEKLLLTLGRVHGWREAVESAALARARGLTNINMDVMFGLPGQTLMDYRETLAAVTALAPAHISAYSLILEEGTPLHARVARGEAVLPDEDAVADMMAAGVEALEAGGYRRYEISNFAKPGFACRHNLCYWTAEKPYLGLGLAAHGMLPPDDEQREVGARHARVANTSDLNAYLSALDDGRLPVEAVEPVGAEEAMLETLMLGLRTTAGVEPDDFERRFGVSLEARYGARVAALRRDGLALPPEETPSGKALALTEKGLMLQNRALSILLC